MFLSSGQRPLATALFRFHGSCTTHGHQPWTDPVAVLVAGPSDAYMTVVPLPPGCSHSAAHVAAQSGASNNIPAAAFQATFCRHLAAVQPVGARATRLKRQAPWLARPAVAPVPCLSVLGFSGMRRSRPQRGARTLSGCGLGHARVEAHPPAQDGRLQGHHHVRDSAGGHLLTVPSCSVTWSGFGIL